MIWIKFIIQIFYTVVAWKEAQKSGAMGAMWEGAWLTHSQFQSWYHWKRSVGK
jgi:hypothetical protein